MFKLVAFSATALAGFTETDNAWDYLRKKHHIPNFYELFEQGKLSRYAMFERENAFWKQRGLTKEKMLQSLIDGYSLLSGARDTAAELHRRGVRMAIIGESPLGFLESVAKQLNISMVAGMDFEWDKAGFPVAPKPTHPRLNDTLDKVAALDAFARRSQARTKECLVVGRSKTDIPMFQVAGFSIAFRAKDPAVERAASVVIRKPNVMDILQYVR